MAINYSTGSGSLVSNPSEGGSFNNEATGELSTALTASNAATLAKIAAELAETNAETAETNAATSATNSANSASAASTSASTATTQAGLATTNGAAQVTLATTQAGLATTNGQAQVTLATTQAGIATTKASEASTSAGNSATSATASSDSATASADSATGAATSASTATTKASEASTSASTATTKASEASTSAGNAAASLATFTGQYVSQSSQPGSPGTGDLWFDTTNNIMKVYNGTNWVNAGSSVNGVQNSVQHIATAGQTTFAATYDITYLQVYLNGGLLASSDYTATNGTSIVLAAAAFVNDIVFIHSFGTFLLADHYSKVAADARYSTITYVDNTVSNLVDSAPATLNTLNELAAALGDDASFSTTVATNIAAKLPLAGGALTGPVTTNSTFDGRDVATDGTKLDGIETSATADQTGAQIKTAYQAETNAFTDAQFTKLGNIEANATADQTGAQIKTAYQAETNAFTDAQFTKLAGVATGANNYTHPANHAISVISGLQAALDDKTTESYVNTEITNLIGGAPGALDTLNELAAAINDDASYASTITTALAGKAPTSHNHNTLYDPIGASVAMAIALGG